MWRGKSTRSSFSLEEQEQTNPKARVKALQRSGIYIDTNAQTYVEGDEDCPTWVGH
jgi:hypothetical protein